MFLATFFKLSEVLWRISAKSQGQENLVTVKLTSNNLNFNSTIDMLVHGSGARYEMRRNGRVMVMVMVTGIRVVVKQSAAPASATSQVHGSSDGGDTGNNRYRHTTNISLLEIS